MGNLKSPEPENLNTKTLALAPATSPEQMQGLRPNLAGLEPCGQHVRLSEMQMHTVQAGFKDSGLSYDFLYRILFSVLC